MDVLHVVERGMAAFEAARTTVDVACAGDSLTSGLLPDRGYPDQLRKMIQLPVVNLGQSGITTEDGLNTLPRLKQTSPQVIVIELGGHDFLTGWDRRTTKANLERLIAACRRMATEVVLMEIRRGFMTDPFCGPEREIACETDVELIPDSGIRRLVLFSPIAPPGMWMRDHRLSDDGIHSNVRGSQLLARYAAASLERLSGKHAAIGSPRECGGPRTDRQTSATPKCDPTVRHCAFEGGSGRSTGWLCRRTIAQEGRDADRAAGN